MKRQEKLHGTASPIRTGPVNRLLSAVTIQSDLVPSSRRRRWNASRAHARAHGQLSLDLLLAMLMLFVFIQGLVAFMGDFELNQEKIAIKLQEKHIISELDKTLKYAYTLKDNSQDTYSIIYTIPKIYITHSLGIGQPAYIQCAINVTDAHLKIDVNSQHYPLLGSTESITETMPRQVYPHRFSEVRCGDTVVIKSENP